MNSKNTVATKNPINIYIGNNPTLSEVVQNLLFKYGYRWPLEGNTVIPYDEDFKIIVAHNNGDLRLSCHDEAVDFYASWEMGKIIEWLELDKEGSDNQAEELKRDIKLLSDAKIRIEHLENEVTNLQEWKDSQIVISENWQEIGQAVDARDGEDCPLACMRYIVEAKGTISYLERENKQLVDDLEAKQTELDNISKSIMMGRNSGNRLAKILSEESEQFTYHHYVAGLSSVSDDYPTPELTEEERKKIGLEYYLGVLKASQKVKWLTRKTQQEYESRYTAIFGCGNYQRAYMMIKDGEIGLMWSDRFEPCDVISVQH